MDDLIAVPTESLKDSSAPTALNKIFHASPSRTQFHLLKFHLCVIIKKVLRDLYLIPPDSPIAKSDRQKWDVAQSVMEDLHELCAWIPPHLQVVNLDVPGEPTYKQQSVFLDILINHTIILVHRPLLGYRKSRSTDNPTADKVGILRENTSREACYAAASGICSMISSDRDEILSLTVHLILSALGVYSSAAEVIALYAITLPPIRRKEAKEAYQNLSYLLRLLARLQKQWPLALPDRAILRDLVRVVRAKVDMESRVPSPEPQTMDQQAHVNGSALDGVQGQVQELASEQRVPPMNNSPRDAQRDHATLQTDRTHNDNLDLQDMDEFLALGDDTTLMDPSFESQGQESIFDDDFSAWIFPPDDNSIEAMEF